MSLEKKILEQNPNDETSETSDDEEEAEYIIIKKRKKAEKNGIRTKRGILIHFSEKKDGEKKGKKGDKKKKGFFKPGVFKQLKADVCFSSFLHLNSPSIVFFSILILFSNKEKRTIKKPKKPLKERKERRRLKEKSLKRLQ